MAALGKLHRSVAITCEGRDWAENDHGLQDCGAPAQDIPQRRGC